MISLTADVVTVVVLGSSVVFTLFSILRMLWARAGSVVAVRVLAAMGTLALAAITVVAVTETTRSINERLDSDYDSGWLSVPRNCRVYGRDIGFNGLPQQITAYYRLDGVNIVPWGMNQAGHTNGVLLDFDGEGTMYVRLPCGHNRADVFDTGYYRSRDDRTNDRYFRLERVEFRVILWE